MRRNYHGKSAGEFATFCNMVKKKSPAMSLRQGQSLIEVHWSLAVLMVVHDINIGILTFFSYEISMKGCYAHTDGGQQLLTSIQVDPEPVSRRGGDSTVRHEKLPLAGR